MAKLPLYGNQVFVRTLEFVLKDCRKYLIPEEGHGLMKKEPAQHKL